jgi:hypothetical protein
MNPPFHPPSVCPSANLSPFHLPHTETRQWGPHPSSSFPATLPPLGHSLHWGTRFCILYIFPACIFLYKPCYYKPLFLSSPLTTCFPFGHTQPMSPLVGVFLLIFPLLTSSISSEHDPGHLPPSSAFIYLVPPLAQLTSDLVVPMTLDLVPTVAATPYIIHPPTKGSLESSHFLTSSMYLCLLITSVDSMEYLLLLGVASPFCRHQHTFPKGRQYLDPHFPFNEGSRTAQEETP